MGSPILGNSLEALALGTLKAYYKGYDKGYYEGYFRVGVTWRFMGS